MDVDPLADVGPPRYNVESDEEEDEYHPLSVASTEPNQTTEVKILGELPQGRNLLVATGDIANFWARGADLGEQTGAITVNKIQVGLVFNPKWSDATIIMSEALTRLPAWCMHQYALTILDSLKPIKIGLLDTYAAPSYIAENTISFQDSPIRYLTSANVNFVSKHKAELYYPPNLIHSTSAAILSILCTKQPPPPSCTILVPSPYIPRPPPKLLGPNNLLKLSEDHFEWSKAMINDAHQLLFFSIGEVNPPQWLDDESKQTTSTISRRSNFGDGTIYI